MEKTEFQTLMLAITGLDTQVTGLRTEVKADLAGLDTKMTQGFARIDREFFEVRKDLKAIREQTALNCEKIAVLKERKSTLNS
jgi:hypothetical protein